ncbi:MAG: 23S rRNA (guanosine(2251)-2'-O)-methyltransferase RlmB [Gammaproteobacteria bacterium]|nr:23S rRNA (guanosine(2251)-2'-O)-methyltransferase RlmB [Gammaproteobacteria bacterium]
MAQYSYGLHPVKKMLQFSIDDCEQLLCLQSQNQRLQDVISLAKEKKLVVTFSSKQELSDLAGSEKHQGCVLKVREGRSRVISLDEILQQVTDDSLFLVLDGVQDPHNLGACLRSADGAGVSAVIVPKDRAVGMTAVVQKVAAGAAESVPLITVTNLSRSLKALKDAGVWLVGTSGDAEQTLYQLTLKGPIALVMGAEGEGMRRLTAEQCDYLVKLPMKGRVESLNVSVATGICLYEVVRQRMS